MLATTLEDREFQWSKLFNEYKELWHNFVLALDVANFKEWVQVIESDKMNKL